jgi:hypothetical protein
MILRFIQLLADLAHATSDACYNDDKTQQARDDRRRESKTQALTLRVILAQCELEKVLPMCKFTPLMHALRHIPSNIHRWNNVRVYWCFFMERYMYVHVEHILGHILGTCLCPINLL